MCCNRTFLTAVIILVFWSAAGCSVSGLFGPASMMSIDANAEFAFSDMAWNPQETRDKQDPPAASKPTAAPPKKSDQTTEVKQQEEPRPKKVSYTRPKRKHRRLFLRSVRRWAPAERSGGANRSEYSSASHSEIGNAIGSSVFGTSALQPSLAMMPGGVVGPPGNPDGSLGRTSDPMCVPMIVGQPLPPPGPMPNCAARIRARLHGRR